MKSLAILTTKSITHNRFLDSITNNLISKYDVILSCKDISNLKKFKKLKKYQVDFPTNINELLDLKRYFLFLNQLYKLVKKVDLIYVHTPIAAHSLRIMMFFIRKEIKIIYHIHGLRYIPNKYSIKSNLFRLFELVLSLKTDIFIVINKLDYSSITKFVNKKKVFFVKGVGISLPKKIKKINNNKKYFIIGVISSFKKEKGFEQLLMIAKLLSSLKNISFYIYGTGNENLLKDKIRKEKLKNIVVKGFVENIEKEINNFNIFLHPSHREGLNVSIQECLARGIPVITTNIRGCKDLIEDGYNGFIYDYLDIDKALNHIIHVYNMDSLALNRLRKNCINYARENLDRKKLSLQIEEIINNNE